MEIVVDNLAEVGIAEECLHNVKSLVDRGYIHQWEHCPAFQHTGSHRSDCAVDDIKQRHSVVLHRLQQLKRAYGELVETHIAVFLDAPQ